MRGGKEVGNLKTLSIDGNEQIFLDGKQVKNVHKYKLEHFAGSKEPAKLTVTIYVNVDQVNLE